MGNVEGSGRARIGCGSGWSAADRGQGSGDDGVEQGLYVGASDQTSWPVGFVARLLLLLLLLPLQDGEVREGEIINRHSGRYLGM